MERIPLKFKSISEVVGSDEVGILVLTDEAETRQLAIACDKGMLYQFRLRMADAIVVPRLLPEVLWHLITFQTDNIYELQITDVIDGQYRALMTNTSTRELVALRASDAVLLAYISHLPIYIDRYLFYRQSTPYSGASQGVALPLNTLSADMLQEALQKAVEEEKYELASHLRDELKKRRQGGG